MSRPTTFAIAAVATLLLAGCSGTDQPPAPGVTIGPDGQPTQSPGTAAANPYPAPSSKATVPGSGASFPKPLIESWAIQYEGLQPSVQVIYPGGGSGKGISDITAKNVLFAGSDAPLSPTEKAGAPRVLQFPETLGLVAVVYNVGGVEAGLRLDGETLGRIYTGAVTRWDDQAIAALNPGVALPDAAIAIVYRSDSSGTTFVFTDYLGKASPSWASAMGATATKKPDWTKSTATQLSGNGNDGVATTVKSTPNSIGYVEYAFLKSQRLSGAAMKNQAGEFVAPTTEGASKAAAATAASLPAPDGDWSKVSIVDAPGAGSYPISSFSYMLVHASLSDYGGKFTANQMAAFRSWAWWALHDGQVYAEPLGYARLPPEAVKVGEDALAMIQA